MSQLNGKIALISGGASGLGAEFARLFIARGARVVVGDINLPAGLALATTLGPQALAVSLDVTQPASWTAAIEQAEAHFGPVDVLVNNAGVAARSHFTEETAESFRAVLEVNLFGTFNGMSAVAPRMKELGRGSIINISSLAGLVGWWHGHGYTTSKFAIRGLTKSAALDMGSDNVRVNSVHPGLVETPMKGALTYATDHVALRRAATPVEIAPLVAFLASDESSYCTGSEFIADGGASAGRRGPAFIEIKDE